MYRFTPPSCNRWMMSCNVSDYSQKLFLVRTTELNIPTLYGLQEFRLQGFVVPLNQKIGHLGKDWEIS
jgi:hypothetical protein